MNYATKKLISECADSAGVEFVDIECGGKHHKVYLRKNRMDRFITISKGSSVFQRKTEITQSMRRVFR